jgi:hypothetical protein
MNFSSRTIRGALLAVTVALAVSAVPTGGATVDAQHQGKKAILAIL